MDEFVRQFLVLRDGNSTPKESYLARDSEKETRKFFVSLIPKLEDMPQPVIEEVLFAAVASGAVHAVLECRHTDELQAVIVADKYLEGFFFPLMQQKVLGRAVPIVTLDGHAKFIISLYHIDDLPLEQRVSMTPAQLLKRVIIPALLGGKAMGEKIN